MKTRRTMAKWLFAASAYVLVATPIWWVVSRPNIDAGRIPATGSARQGTALLGEGRVLALAKVAVRSARLSEQQPSTEAVAPKRVAIPALGVDAPVIPVGVEPKGGMEVPEDVATVGWYRF